MTTEERKSKSYDLIPIIILVLTNLTSLGLGSYMTGESPEPVDVTCELAAEIAASVPCTEDAEDATEDAEDTTEDAEDATEDATGDATEDAEERE